MVEKNTVGKTDKVYTDLMQDIKKKDDALQKDIVARYKEEIQLTINDKKIEKKQTRSADNSDKNEQERQEYWQKVKEGHKQFEESGMRGYEEWVTGMCTILKALLNINKALNRSGKVNLRGIAERFPQFGAVLDAPDTLTDGLKSQLKRIGVGCLEKLHLLDKKPSDDNPEIAYEFDINDSGELTYEQVRINGMPIDDYFSHEDYDKNTKKKTDLIDEFKKGFRDRFEEWLKMYGCTLTQASPNDKWVIKDKNNNSIERADLVAMDRDCPFKDCFAESKVALVDRPSAPAP